jgi:lycopene cyclase domain-containing protein
VKFEYLLLNLLIFGGPFGMSFEKQVRFVTKWRYAFPAIFITAVPFLIWDAMAAGSHWWFNERYTLNWRLAGLPIEEWLFFITVPFAGLFVWEVVKFYFPDREIAVMNRIRYFIYPLQLLGLLIFAKGKEYTGLVLIVAGTVAILDRILKTNLLLRQQALIFLAIALLLILIFNSYLTWRPIVLYGEAYQLGLRIGTIPIEDFGYGLSLILLAAIFYEKFLAFARPRSMPAKMS